MAMRYSVPAARSDVLGTFLSSTGPSIYSAHRPEKAEWKLRDQGFFYATLLTWTHSLSRFGRRPSRAKRLMLRDSDPNIQIQVSSNTLELTRRGDAKKMHGDFSEAIEDLDLALELEPKSAIALKYRGNTKIGLSDFAGAIADLDLALQLAPNDAFALSSRGEAKRELGDFSEAIEDLDLALKLEPGNAFALRVRGAAKRRLGDYSEAIEDLDEALKLEPGNAFALSIRGEAKRRLGDYSGAMADLDLALKLDPKDAFTLRSRGDAKRMLGDFSEAIEDLDLALELEPENAWALRHRGDAKRMLDDFAGAIADLDLALKLEPKNAFGLSSRGEAKRQRGDFAGAIEDLDLALELEPKNAVALQRRGVAKLNFGDFAGAIADLDLALELEPEDAWVLRHRGDAKRMLDDFAGAIADLDLALELEPENAFALSRRGEAKRRLGDFSEAVADLDVALQVDPTNSFALARRGEVKRMFGYFVAAIEDLNLALQLEPNNTFALVVRSEVKRQQKDLKGAMADLDLLVRLEPKSCFLFCRRGEAKQQQGDIAGAISDFESALGLDPNDPCARRGHSEALKALWVLGKQTVLTRLQAGQALKWAIIGAGPVGLTLALSLAEAMWQKGMDPTAVGIEVYESRWIEELPDSNDAPKWQRNCKRPRRAQVVTLQDSVVESFSEQTQPAFAGERVWPDSQNLPVADVEERLLETAQQEPFCKYIHICKTTFLTDEHAHATWLESLDADVVVAADGAGSMSRRAFPNGFVCPASEGANTDAQQIRLGETTDDFEEADFALGIALKPDARPPQSQAMNVVLTLAQNVYLLNSQEGSRGFLNIRLTKEEYNAILEATGCKGCPFGSPIRLYDEMEIEDAQNEIRVKLPWLRRRIEEGLKLFGMQLDHMEFITGFQLRPAYAQCFYHVLPSQSATTSSPKVLLLAGDAAISHHFWPGRGLNTGLKSAVAMVNMWKASDDSGLGEGIKLYNAFMEKLCQREMQGRSASMMRQDMRLPWAGTLLSCKSSEAQKLKQVAKNQELSNREKFLENCKMVRDFLEKLPGWPHKHLSDDELEEKILHRVAKPKDLELHLMVLSAFDNGPGRAPGWPTSLQCGAEVDPSNKAHWIEEIQFLSSIWCGSV